MSDHIKLAKKLHRLVISSNVNEAVAAATKLSELVQKHELRLSDLDAATETVVYQDRIIYQDHIVYQDRIVHQDRIVYRDRIIYEYVYQDVPTPMQPPKQPSRYWLDESHHKIGDNMDSCLQRCSCGEWLTDSNFQKHMDTIYYAQRHAR